MKDQWYCAPNDLEELGSVHYSNPFLLPPPPTLRMLVISRIQSLHLPLEEDDHDVDEYSLVWHWESEKRICFFLNISPRSFTQRYSSWGWAGKSTSSCFALAFDRLAKANTFVFQRKIFELHLKGFLLVVVVLLVAQVRDQLIWTMRNSDPRVRIVLVHRLKF